MGEKRRTKKRREKGQQKMTKNGYGTDEKEQPRNTPWPVLGLSPQRSMAHKAIALATGLMEPLRLMEPCAT